MFPSLELQLSEWQGVCFSVVFRNEHFSGRKKAGLTLGLLGQPHRPSTWNTEAEGP